MIPAKTFKALVFATNIAWLCGAIPFRFVKQAEGRPQIVPSFTKWRALFVRTSFTLNCFYILFIAYRIIHKLLRGEELTVDFLVQMGYLFFSYGMTVVLQINTLLFYQEMPSFAKRYIDFFNKIRDLYILPGEKGPRCNKFFTSVLTIGILVNLQNIIIILKKPDRLHFLTSLFEYPLKTPFRKKLPVLLMQSWIWCSTWAHVWTYGFHQYCYISCMVWTIREMDCEVKEPKTRDKLRHRKVFTKTLRSMHVLHRLWQQSHQNWFCPSHKFVAISVGSLASYGVLKLHGPRSIVMGCMTALSLLYLWTLFRKFGQLYELAEEVRDNWINSPSTTKWMKRYLRSVPIFRVDVGAFYYVKKTTVIAIIYTVLNNTVTLLFL